MALRLNREAYAKLISEDIKWLNESTESSLEQAHVIQLLEHSVRLHYDHVVLDRDAYNRLVLGLRQFREQNAEQSRLIANAIGEMLDQHLHGGNDEKDDGRDRCPVGTSGPRRVRRSVRRGSTEGSEHGRTTDTEELRAPDPMADEKGKLHQSPG